MKTFFKKTAKGALVESNLIGTNPTRSNESIWVRFKKETSGKYSVEIHSNDRDTDQPWAKENNPWSSNQLVAAELYGFTTSFSNVLRTKTSFNSIEEALANKARAIPLAKALSNVK